MYSYIPVMLKWRRNLECQSDMAGNVGVSALSRVRSGSHPQFPVFSHVYDKSQNGVEAILTEAKVDMTEIDA